MRPMTNLLFVGPYPPPFGGVSCHLEELLPELADAGYRVRCLDLSGQNETSIENGVKVIRRDKLRGVARRIVASGPSAWVTASKLAGISTRERLRAMNAAALIAEAVEEEPTDAIFMYQLEDAFPIPILRDANRLKQPIGLMVFGSLYSQAKRFEAARASVRSVVDGCDVLLASSAYCGAALRHTLGFEDEVEVIYIGVDTDRFTPNASGFDVRRELGLPADAVVYLFLGRMLPVMGLDVLLECADRLLDIGPDAYLVLAGASGILEQDAMALAARHPRVRFVRNVPASRKPAFYAAADAVLAPTRELQACMGVAIKEAMASARPVIATATGGIPEAIVDGQHGLLVPIVDNRADGTTLLAHASTLYRDPSVRRRMGEAGRQRVLERFSNERTAQKYIGVLERWSALATQSGEYGIQKGRLSGSTRAR